MARRATSDPVAIADIAAREFARTGFSATTMDMIAAAAGVSRKSLFLYFPSKADLIWHRAGQFGERLAEDLDVAAAADVDDPIVSLIDAVVEGIGRLPIATETLRIRARLHASDPEVREIVESRGAYWRAVVEAYLVRVGVDADGAAPMVAYGFWHEMWAAFEHWAREGGEPEAVVAHRLVRLARVLAMPLVAAPSSATAFADSPLDVTTLGRDERRQGSAQTRGDQPHDEGDA